MERRNDERDSLRAACRREIDELREADDDEPSDVLEAVAQASAEAAAKTAHRITLPDSDAPPKKKHGASAIAAAIVTLGAAAAAAVEALRQAGWIK